MNLAISHLTRYDHDCEVRLHPHLLYLRPRENPLLHVSRFAFTFEPAARVDWMRDDFDNPPASALFSGNAATLDIQSECFVGTADVPPFDFIVRDYATTFPFAHEPLHRCNLSVYLTPPATTTQDVLRGWLDQHFTVGPRETVTWLMALNQAVQRNLVYRRRDEPGMQFAFTTITGGTGSCRDFAVLLVECLRTLGLAARFVSGYMYDPADTDSGAGSIYTNVPKVSDFQICFGG